MQRQEYLHSSFHHKTLQQWSSNQSSLSKSSLIYPIFVTDAQASSQIQSLPGISKLAINDIKAHIAPLIKKGLKSVLVFGVPTTTERDNPGSIATSDTLNPAILAIKLLRKEFDGLLVCVDVCLCAFTSHGHCGVLKDGSRELDNRKSIARIAELAGVYAMAGAHVVAPSDMMDGRIAAIKDELIRLEKASTCCLMSYSAKFASVLYGPFRDAAGSGIKGDGETRQHYQLPPQSRGLARRALQRDVAEGADIIMVKPGYLDVIRDAREVAPDHTISVYQVSGEYAMLWYAAEKGVFTLKEGVLESFSSIYRAGGNVIISYYTPLALDWIDEDRE